MSSTKVNRPSMTTFISMLRGINVSGQKKVRMEDLREIYAGMGYRNVRTYIQSGNVVFDHKHTDAPLVVDGIEKELGVRLGFSVPVVVRSSEEFKQLIARTPFRGLDESKLHVTFLAAEPARIPTDELARAKVEGEDLLVSGREVYLFCPNGYGGTKLNNTFFEKRLGVTATTRNWRTVNALSSLANQP